MDDFLGELAALAGGLGGLLDGSLDDGVSSDGLQTNGERHLIIL